MVLHYVRLIGKLNVLDFKITDKFDTLELRIQFGCSTRRLVI